MAAPETNGSPSGSIYKVKFYLKRHYHTIKYGYGGTYHVFFKSKAKAMEYIKNELHEARENDPDADAYDAHICSLRWKIKRVACEDDDEGVDDEENSGEEFMCKATE